MPDVIIDKGITLDLLDQQKPGTSATSDMPVIETHPDAVQKKQPDAAAAKPKEDESATSDTTADTAAEPEAKRAKGVQKRIDELTRQREDERRARIKSDERFERLLGMLEKQTTGVGAQPQALADDAEPAEPDISKYTDQAAYNADYRTYLRTLARYEGRQEFKAQQKREAEERGKQAALEQQRKAQESYQSNLAKARQKYADYDDVAGNPALAITRPMANAIVEAGETGIEIAYHLGRNPEEAERISKLPILGQLMELGKIAAAVNQPQAAATTAPAPKSVPKPITPITAGSGAPSSSRGEETMEAYAARRATALAKERVPGGARH